MSNIVVLSGSVRKDGNTELLVQAFVDGAKKNNSVEVISVADYKVNPCIGCNTCFDREGHKCFQKDDMTKVYEKLKVADVLVIASPIYFYGVNGQVTDIKIVSDQLQKSKQRLNRILAENTGKAIEEICRDTERDNFMTATEALQYGLIDQVIEKR